MSATTSIDFQESISRKIGTRIFEFFEKELNKTENKEKIDCVKSSVSLYILKAINPYIIAVILIMMIILCLQGFLVAKLI